MSAGCPSETYGLYEPGSSETRVVFYRALCKTNQSIRTTTSSRQQRLPKSTKLTDNGWHATLTQWVGHFQASPEILESSTTPRRTRAGNNKPHSSQISTRQVIYASLRSQATGPARVGGSALETNFRRKRGHERFPVERADVQSVRKTALPSE